jgi:hypothetical protein
MKSIKVNYHVMRDGLDQQTYDTLKNLLDNNASMQQLLQFNAMHNIVPVSSCCTGARIDIVASLTKSLEITEQLKSNEEDA